MAETEKYLEEGARKATGGTEMQQLRASKGAGCLGPRAGWGKAATGVGFQRFLALRPFSQVAAVMLCQEPLSRKAVFPGLLVTPDCPFFECP